MNGRTPWRIVNLAGTVALLLGLAPPGGISTALADHTSTPTRVTVPGDFNSEIGCSNGDWSPSCNGDPGSITATPDPLQANDLVNQGNGVWARAIDIPAASTTEYLYKAAINGDWSESYKGRPANGDNTSLTLPTTTTVKFYYDHKTHYVADNVGQTIYTVPGDFNSELGCSGDWQPECLRTFMTDPDGDGIFTFYTDAIPAGSYLFKVATDENWNNPNYGAGGGGDNISFSVPSAGLGVTFSFDSSSNVPSIKVDVPPPAADAALIQTPANNAANQDEIFYFVLPDRFANGNTANDQGGLTGDALKHGFLPTDKGYYHGGDIAGLEAKLPYLKELGVTAIWMTPILKNKPVQGDGTIAGSSSAYHGYWTVDFTAIDPHLGSTQDLKDLIAAAHGEGIRVFFDIITNHTANVIDNTAEEYSYISKKDSPYRDAGGNIIDDTDYINAPTFPQLNTYSFPRSPIIWDEAEKNVKVPAWLNDVTMYHNRGDSKFDGSESDTYGDFVGLDDLFTERPEVVAGMVQIYKDLITEFKIDGFRVDTVKHVNIEFWQKFVPEIRAHASAQNINDFFIFGEVFSGDPKVTSKYTKEAEYPAVLDFGFQGSASGFAAYSSATNNLRDFFAGDDYYTTADDNAYDLPTFLSNHDIGRINADIVTRETDAAQRLQRAILANALMFTARGIPIVYYGDEQGFSVSQDLITPENSITGGKGDKNSRQSLFASQVSEYQNDVRIGGGSGSTDSYSTTHPLFLAIKELAALRKANPALQHGAQIHRYSEGSAGVYAFSRIDRTAKVEYVVALNNSETDKTVTLSTFKADGVFNQIYGGTGSVNSNGAGQISITVPALSAVVYKQAPAVNLAQASTAPLGPYTVFTNPVSGTDVLGTIEVAANLSGNVFAEVSFAVSANGGDFQPLGVDTNAPYRIFYDAGQHPVGTQLIFKAVAVDLLGAEGNFNSATTIVNTGTPEVCTVQYQYAIIHYNRADGNYDDWGLHLWGDGLATGESTEWNTPKPFVGRTEYGAFAFIKIADQTKPVNFIVHGMGGAVSNDTKDPDGDNGRNFTPKDNPQVFLKSGDAVVYPSQAAAQGYVTIHYNRPAGDYNIGEANYWGAHVWGDAVTAETSWSAPLTGTLGAPTYNFTDSFGLAIRVPIKDATKPVNFILHQPSGDDVPATREVGGNRSFNPDTTPAIWIHQEDETVYASRSAAEGVVTLRYHRPGGDYGDYSSNNYVDFWGLHLWNGSAQANPAWETPFKPNLTEDSFGIGFRVELAANAESWNYILHRGDSKDKPSDQLLVMATTGNEIWVLQEIPGDYPYLLPVQPACSLGKGNVLAKSRAHWISEGTIAWPITASPQITYRLHYSENGDIAFENGQVTGGMSLTLIYDPQGINAEDAARFPHLRTATALKLPPEALSMAKNLLRGELVVSASTPDLGVVEVTSVQIPGVLDSLYTEAARSVTLGPTFGPVGATVAQTATIGLSVWAPTARSVKLHLFNTATITTSQVLSMTLDADSGVWGIGLPSSAYGKFYLYEVAVYVPSTGKVETNFVTDPYAVSLSMNSTRSQIIDLNAEAVKPLGWDQLSKPQLDAFEDIVLYELHIRDFSATDETVPENYRGTYKAFTLPNSAGMTHLSRLANAGLTHIHLLPTFDIATINEDKSKWEAPDPDLLANAEPYSTTQQAAVNAIRDKDGFNWGYDPYHYNVPEGSYSTDPNGPTRVVEFRQMVQSLNQRGLRVVMDVVYNHTSASGQADKSVLDKIVPGYYHRLSADGAIEKSTCCDNTATEQVMMEKLMIDSLVLWAKAYKVDGFRFDLMGHHTKQNLLNVRAALDALTIEKDGVDGSKIYIYGEGWNFGEVANGQRGVNATQRNLPGTGIGTFSDRLRDAVRGGGPFDSGDASKKQGFITGLAYDPNNLDQGNQTDTLLHYTDQIKIGMAGNLANYQLLSSDGITLTGEQIDYNGSPAGYTTDPQEVITYIEAHDNETLFDAIQSKASATATITDRVRMQNMGASIVMLGQGVPFFHAGQDILRSKSGDRNSYNSGDWFNRVDWTLDESTWGSGLPMQGENNNNWPVFAQLLRKPELKPGRTEMVNASDHFIEMLRIRKSSPLFRLRTAAEINSMVHFLNNGPDQVPGLIVMHIADTGTADVDPNTEHIVALFNATDEAITFKADSLDGLALGLHPIQRLSRDAGVLGAKFNATTNTFTIPARTTAVFTDMKAQLLLPMIRSGQ